MLFLSHFIGVLLLHLPLFALGQQITLINPTANTPIPQCGQVPITWSGGTPPYSLSISTTSNATTDSVEFTPVIRDTTSLWVVDLPAGTPFNIAINDGGDNPATSPVLIVQPSSNTTCIESDNTDPPPSTTHAGHGVQTSSSNTGTGNSATSVPTRTATPSGLGSTNSGKMNASSHSHMAAIAGIAVAVVVILVVIALLFFLKRRKDKRRNNSSRDNLVAAFGPDKAGLDDTPVEEMNESAIPEPYVYRSVNRSRDTDLVSGGEESGLRRNPTTTTNESSNEQRTDRIASRKGERYLPNLEGGNSSNSPASSNPANRMQEEDIDRLAARMVAIMASGRISDQAWSPAPRDGRHKGIILEDTPPPPLYHDVTKGEGRRPTQDAI